MSKQRSTPEFRDEADRQVVERGYRVSEVAERLGVSTKSLHKRVKAVKPTLAREIVLGALLTATWRRKPVGKILVHPDPGSQYGSDDWQRFCRHHKLEPGMSRKGNCRDNAVAESSFSSLKKERIKKRVYKTRALARADIFDYIEVLYNCQRRHSHLGGVSPEVFEAASW